VADKRCENGHFIDESWDLCPYCPQDQSEPEIPVVRPRAVEAAPPAPPASPQPRALPSLVQQDVSLPPLHGPALVPPLRSGGTSPAAVAIPQPAERTVAASRQDLNAARRYVVGWLVGLSGSARGESYAVRLGRNVIGRDRRSDVIVNDDQASSHHADLVFRPDEKRFILMDHNSTNGTYVNEIEIEPRRDLSNKDVIRVGSHRYLFIPLCHDGFHWDDEGLLK
jgi:FHA domain